MKITNLKKEDIIRSYNYTKKLAFKAFKAGDFEKSLHYIQISTHVAYNFNWIYSDDDFEQLLTKISNALLKPKSNYKCLSNHYVFYDSFSTDNRALTQQYIRALMALGCDFLYIAESSKKNEQGEDIFKELESYKKVEVFEIPQNIGSKEILTLVYDKIVSYKPTKLFMHIHPWSVSAITVFNALPKGIIKYKINLTDHAFWLGNRCLDYSVEFRPRGCTLSEERRNISKDQILFLPYYPIKGDHIFKGFPKECTKEKIIIFSGGSPYKVYGKNGEYFDLIRNILIENPNTIFLYAGDGDLAPMRKFIKRNYLKERFILIGNRRDINAVFEHCDIYLGTYPIQGGLMSQLAAINGKPIIAYASNDLDGIVEGIVCYNGIMHITYTDKNLFFNEVKHLIDDADYRKQKGSEIKACLPTKKQFEENFQKLLNSDKTEFNYKDVKINYDAVFQLYLEIENKFQYVYKTLILKEFKLKTVYLNPKIIMWFAGYLFCSQGRGMILRKIFKMHGIAQNNGGIIGV